MSPKLCYTTLCYFLGIVMLWTQKTGKIEYEQLGISIEVPSGWIAQEGDGFLLIGSQTVPGFIMLTTHNYDVEQLRSEALNGMQFDQGSNLFLSEELQNISSNAISGMFSGTMEYQSVKAYIIGVENPYKGVGVTIMAATQPQLFSTVHTAVADQIYASLNFKEVDIALTNCIFGGYKFLYISPEKLQNELVQSKISDMKVNLIAIDEAHCISKWGHNFRPQYRNISLIREIHPYSPVLALTATATKDVVSDIQANLDFKKHNLIQSSFYRENLSYIVIKEQDKNRKLIKILKKINGSTIVYVKSRKDCEKISKLLVKNNISANYYHAGLNIDQRNEKQENWKKSKSRVMVATNAFGMGIDKSDVRLVIHFHIPSTIESYFQETGRAGRDKKESFAVLLYNSKDEKYLKNFVELHFPSVKEIKECYQNLANHFQLSVNNGEEKKFDSADDLTTQLQMDKKKCFELITNLKKTI